jgi:hypothetical protein
MNNFKGICTRYRREQFSDINERRTPLPLIKFRLETGTRDSPGGASQEEFGRKAETPLRGIKYISKQGLAGARG